MDTEPVIQPVTSDTLAEQASDVVTNAVTEEDVEGKPDTVQEDDQRKTLVSLGTDSEWRQGSEPLTEDDKKAARKERIKRNLQIRFTVNEHEPEEILKADIPEQYNEEVVETEESEHEPSTSSDDMHDIPDEKHLQGNTKVASVLSMMEEEVGVESFFTDEEEDEDIIDTLKPPKGDTVLAKTIFLENFEVPSLSDISDDLDIEEEIKRLASKHSLTDKPSSIVDIGRFVNPLTGEVLSSSSTSSTSSTVIEVASDLDSESDRWTLSDDDPYGIILPPQRQVEEDNLDEMFVKFQGSFIHERESVYNDRDWELSKHKRELHQIAIDFLYKLFNAVVNDVENVNEDTVLRNKLDKAMLHESLTRAVRAFKVEKETNSYLNSKMCEYFKRMKNFRVFTSLEPEIEIRERARYFEAASILDHRLNVASETKKKNAILMSSVIMDLAYVQNICLHTEEHLEHVFTRTLATNKSDFIKRIVERELRLIDQKRNEISDTRLFLITRKHTLGRIMDKIYKLEQISEELCMNDFISIQNQVVALDKKIEERNNDLKKLRFSYHTELHLTQHNREKAVALVSKLHESRSVLSTMMEKQRQLRESLYAAKLERNSIRKQHSDLSFQGGLLSMPGLMFDYDQTVEKVMAKTANVKELKETFKRVTQRIAELETRCA